MKELNIKIKYISGELSDVPLPEYMTEGSSGMDLRAAVIEQQIIKPFERACIPTGLQVSIPQGFEGQVRPRSGLAVKHGVTVLNTPGTIDSDYRGEIKVILINFGHEDFIINRGDRIAQLVFAEVIRTKLTLETDIDSTERGAGGFGHTGK
jgi:dUTP pyrophosphatase